MAEKLTTMLKEVRKSNTIFFVLLFLLWIIFIILNQNFEILLNIAMDNNTTSSFPKKETTMLSQPMFYLVNIMFVMALIMFGIKILMEFKIKDFNEIKKKLAKAKMEQYENDRTKLRASITDEDMAKNIASFSDMRVRMKELLKEENSPLDYISYYNFKNIKKPIRIEESIEGFDKKLSANVISKTADEQIANYRNIARSLQNMLDTLNNEFKILEQKSLFKTIFDVEKGGIFYYHFDDEEFLFGATIIQTHMDTHHADGEMKKLFEDIKIGNLD